MHRSRLLGSLAVVVAAAFALAGCSLLPVAVSAAHAPASSVPKVGQCWNVSKEDADNWADWEGSAAISCSKSHVLYTYAVGKISGISSKSWAVKGTSNTLSNDVLVKAEDVCAISTLLPKLKWNQQLVDSWFFVPTLADWKAGARWVRCDVGVLGYGTTLDNEVLAKLPAKISTLKSTVSADPAEYEFCIDSPVPISESGPLDNPDARIADCRQHPQWALVGHGNMPEVTGAPYPGEPTANTEAGAICSKYVQNSSESWIAYLPAKSDWTKTNARNVDCWIGQKADGGGSGTVT
jgi:hypothetical protein